MTDLEWLAAALLRKRRLLTIWNVHDDANIIRIDNPAFDYHAFTYCSR